MGSRSHPFVKNDTSLGVDVTPFNLNDPNNPLVIAR
jgi:hypothetical protein